MFEDAAPGEVVESQQRLRRLPSPIVPRIGVVNLMPRAEEYEGTLARSFALGGEAVELVWIRLRSHPYSSSDPARIQGVYRLFAEAAAEAPLSGLVVTGAPVEELPFDQVAYWGELEHVIRTARERQLRTLGLCWGGMALAHGFGVQKVRFDKKLFGVFELQNLRPAAHVPGGDGGRFCSPQSRHSGIEDGEIERVAAAGVIRPLAYSREAGYSVFESTDGSAVMHLGHPEYDADRLALEYRRDVALGRTDVAAPTNYDVASPSETWSAHRAAFFGGFVRSLRGRIAVVRGDVG